MAARQTTAAGLSVRLRARERVHARRRALRADGEAVGADVAEGSHPGNRAPLLGERQGGMMAFNLVEAIQEPDADCAFDQPCKFGHRVESHAIYCHNDAWTDSPRKCRRSWYTGGETKDEDCPGYQPNPEYKGMPAPSSI